MKAADTGDWKFTQKPTDNSEIKCPECGEFSPLSEWNLGYVECELCTDHDAMECPKCFDSIGIHKYYSNDPFEVREPDGVK